MLKFQIFTKAMLDNVQIVTGSHEDQLVFYFLTIFYNHISDLLTTIILVSRPS